MFVVITTLRDKGFNNENVINAKGFIDCKTKIMFIKVWM